ncbi:MAG: hypothetical protein KDD69_09645 [Bdellovibrionales bacterium]|nr:hypothetical protein [Bdellovibrionales bacterium]
MNESKRHPASYRDPSGFVFIEGDRLLRQVNSCYLETYQQAKGSGLYQELHQRGWLVSHEEASQTADALVLAPEVVEFVTYPYEWSFPQYRDAALLTLDIQAKALDYGMVLKDASMFNVTFHRGAPIFLDTLSFHPYREGEPWHAFSQFLEHFLAPLLLAQYLGPEALGSMSRYMEGLPLATALRMLPWRARLRPLVFSNILLPQRYQRRHEQTGGRRQTGDEGAKATLSRRALNDIIRNLQESLANLETDEVSEWGQYYCETNYSAAAFEAKKRLVAEWVAELRVKRVWDIGGNDGTFSRILGPQVESILCSDADAVAVGKGYRRDAASDRSRVLQFVADITKPSPGIGWMNIERTSLLSRLAEFDVDLVLALAVIHHLTLQANLPFETTAEMFARFGKYLLIELPTERDSKVVDMLDAKRAFRSQFEFYCQENFERRYLRYFSIVKTERLPDSERMLYLMERRPALEGAAERKDGPAFPK